MCCFSRKSFMQKMNLKSRWTPTLRHMILEQEAVKERLGSICEKLTEIDEQISTHSRGWKLDRIGKEELAILRLAVYEVIFDEEIPVGVAINEAVELGKKYGAEGGAAFINGMLGNIADE